MARIDKSDTGRASNQFVKSVMTLPMLDAEREQELARAWRENQDEKALHELTSAYMRLVVSLATRFRHYGLPVSDLIQEGCVGLMQAAARFEPEKGVRFSTYAAWWIRAAVQDFVLRNWSIVRTGTTSAHKALFFNLRRLRTRIKDGLQPRLSPEGRAEIAETLGVSTGDVEVMEARLSASDRSLNAPVSEANGGDDWQDLLPDEEARPEDTVIATFDRTRRAKWLEEAFKVLNDREELIVRKRRLTEEGMTLEALGGELGISKERVRQIERRALGKLKAALTERLGDPVDAGLVANTA